MQQRVSFFQDQSHKKSDGEAYTTLRHAIIGLYLQPGAILSIKEICEMFGMGRSPVRDALIRLDQEGLVVLLPQRGTMISRIDLSRVEQEQFLRFSVEEDVMKLFMACHTPSDITLLQEIVREQQALWEEKDIDIRHFLQLDNKFHQIIYEVTQKLFCFQTILNVSGHYQRIRLLTCNDAGHLKCVLDQHQALITAFQARDTQTMLQVFCLHLSKLGRQEQTLLKKYPGLFEGGVAPSVSIWQEDFLSMLKFNS